MLSIEDIDVSVVSRRFAAGFNMAELNVVALERLIQLQSIRSP
jgi:hypothetical protein